MLGECDHVGGTRRSSAEGTPLSLSLLNKFFLSFPRCMVHAWEFVHVCVDTRPESLTPFLPNLHGNL